MATNDYNQLIEAQKKRQPTVNPYLNLNTSVSDATKQTIRNRAMSRSGEMARGVIDRLRRRNARYGIAGSAAESRDITLANIGAMGAAQNAIVDADIAFEKQNLDNQYRKAAGTAAWQTSEESARLANQRLLQDIIRSRNDEVFRDRSFDYNAERDALNDQFRDDQVAYSREQDLLARNDMLDELARRRSIEDNMLAQLEIEREREAEQYQMIQDFIYNPYRANRRGL